ncbi:hypothetical protein [Sphingomonas sp.]|uniref:hypothetical protein n=1 Tax=Sphingomonas sp. TaxID=28214 RepID=UPI002EDB4C04
MIRKTPATLPSVAIALASAAAMPAHAQEGRRVVVAPYIELGQVLDADLNSGDVLTYTSLAAGIDAAVATARAQAQISYRYERRISWDDDIGDDDIHSGLARGTLRLVPGLSVEAGALATRTRADIRGAAPGLLTGDADNVSQLYSLYAGPSYASLIGPVSVGADYRIGYTKAETPNRGTVVAGVPRLDYYDDSLSHLATARASIAPNTILPVGLTASAGYEREDAGQLDARYEGWYGRGDVLLPVSPTVALTAGAGYERITTSQRDPLLTAARVPVVDGNGRFVSDPASPRRVAYRTDGVYYDAGVVWRPNRRTSLEAHAGKRYGTWSYTGALAYQASKDVGLQVQVYDSVQTFGRQLRQGLASLPTGFVNARDSYSQQFNGCVFGTSGDAPGGCLNDVFQSISTASYRSRGIDGVLTATRGRSTFGAGAGYSNRKLFAPNSGSGIVTSGLNDQSWYGQLFYARTLTSDSGVNTNAFVNYYDSDLAGGEDILSIGATASYYHVFGRLQTTGTVGLYHFDQGSGLASALSAQALISARYTF